MSDDRECLDCGGAEHAGRCEILTSGRPVSVPEATPAEPAPENGARRLASWMGEQAAKLPAPVVSSPGADRPGETRQCARCGASYRWYPRTATTTETFSHLIRPSDGHLPVLYADDAKFYLLAASVRSGEQQ